jgi:AcrR family transcriptional regulator
MSSSTAVKPLTSRGEVTRQRIIEAAAGLIFDQGITTTTLDQVREATRTSKSQLYHYFADKSDLVRAVIAFQTDRLLDSQRPLLDNLDSWEKLHDWADRMVQLGQERNCRHGCPIGSLARQIVDHDETARLDIVRAFDRWERYLLDGFTELQARGELTPGADPADITTAFMSAMQGGLLLSQARRDPKPFTLAMDAAVHYAESFRP